MGKTEQMLKELYNWLVKPNTSKNLAIIFAVDKNYAKVLLTRFIEVHCINLEFKKLAYRLVFKELKKEIYFHSREEDPNILQGVKFKDFVDNSCWEHRPFPIHWRKTLEKITDNRGFE